MEKRQNCIETTRTLTQPTSHITPNSSLIKIPIPHNILPLKNPAYIFPLCISVTQAKIIIDRLFKFQFFIAITPSIPSIASPYKNIKYYWQ
jgi:hypothetical protein